MSGVSLCEGWEERPVRAGGQRRFGARHPAHPWRLMAGAVSEALVPGMRGSVREPVDQDRMFDPTSIPPSAGAARRARGGDPGRR